MTTHVFIGAGPANLDRALKIRQRDPNAKFVFIDNRVSIGGELDRNRSRANIFRFPLSEKKKIIDAGMDEEAFNRVSTDRDFSEHEGFQKGDTEVFGAERFTQIQIRDLQQLYLNELKGNNTAFFDINVDLDIFRRVTDKSHIKESIRNSIQEEINLILSRLSPSESVEFATDNARLMYLEEQLENFENADDLTYHVAAGALQEGATRDESTTPDTIIYPAKERGVDFSHASPDLAAMPVTAMHGTTTFKLPEGFDSSNFVNNTISLDDTDWQEALSAHGWNLLRPPRVRLFYANDTLYIGTEVPASFAKEIVNGRPNENYKRMQEGFAREIAKLMLPNYANDIGNVDKFVANRSGVNAPSYFLTNRGETGDVLNISENATVLAHGDRRYLPHYQTGSGFVTATQQNDLYVAIYLKDNFNDLYKWAFDNGHITNSKEQVYKEYKKVLENDQTIRNIESPELKRVALENIILKNFKADLYTVSTHDVLDANKEKVNKYFTQIQNQALSILGENQSFKQLIRDYNKNYVASMHVSSHFKPRKGKKEGLNPDSEIDPSLRPIVIMEMLLHGSDEFLLRTLPKLINVDLTDLNLHVPKDREQLHRLRDSFTEGYMKYVNSTEVFQKLSESKQKILIHDIVRYQDKPEMVRKKIADVVGICPSHPQELKMFSEAIMSNNPIFNFALEVRPENRLENDEIIAYAQRIKDVFDQHPELKKTNAGFGFFRLKGVHTDKINRFNKELDDIINGDAQPSSKQQKLSDSLIRFQKELIDGKSQRTIDVLSEAVHKAKESAPEIRIST